MESSSSGKHKTVICTGRDTVAARKAELRSIPALDACRNKYRVVTTVLIYENPVYINTDVLSNTTFRINTGLTITVDNAPTSFDLTTTYTSKFSTVDTVYASPAHPTSLNRGLPFTLLIAGLAKSHLRRQNSGGSYLGSNGTVTTSCSSASTYTLSNGQLYEQINGVTLEFSAESGIGYEYFIPSSSPASITTTFSLGEGGSLQWINDDFFNGNALFCALSNGSIIAVFVQNSEPSGCDFVDITIGDVSGCVAAQAGPSGPQGVSGLSGMPGPSGPSGLEGASGISGMAGPSGPSGPVGPVGSSGVSGMPGPSGPQGSPGISGMSGPSGPSGPTGPQGISGISGLQGPSGPSGPSGPQGVSGTSGMPGPSGPPGPTGPQGISGLSGMPGPSGPSGPSGASGVSGASGASGMAGPTG
ncbi:hypothetical protein MMC11_000711 [Xylographa trunciseda]|nr:hypothetical protein [Xylographa trunciseda]